MRRELEQFHKTEAAPIKCAGRESAGRPTDSSVESAGLPTESPIQSAGRLADSLPAHFIGAASEAAPIKCAGMPVCRYAGRYAAPIKCAVTHLPS